MPTGIDWTDETLNCVTGCTPVSAGCENCYAKPMTRRLQAMGSHNYVDGFDKVRCHPKVLNKPYHWRKPRRIFINSMSDSFHDDVPTEFQVAMVKMCEDNPQHTFQFLTKRPENMRRLANEIMFPPNMWCGVTVENAENLWRLKTLRQIHCALRFASMEPLLERLPKMKWLPDWVIVGGESGPGARPMHPDWVRGIRDQCKERDIPFFFKQWGKWRQNWLNESPFLEKSILFHLDGTCSSAKGLNSEQLLCLYNSRSVSMLKIDKGKAGNKLDGQTWEQFPKGAK